MKREMKALAKINLGLAIKGKRPDGMHDIETVMHAIELHDDVIITPQEDESLIVRCDDESVPSGRDNIVFSTVELIRGLYKIKQGLDIEIIKRIPSAAGLGGGSSDSAVVIEALNDMWRLDMSLEEKMDIALMSGADVPFFLSKGASLVEGVGEMITELNPLPEFDVVLVKPLFDISTASAYARWDELNLPSTSEKCRHLAEAMKTERSKEYWISNLKSMIDNSFLGIAKVDYPEIEELIGKLYSRGAFACGMTGSGPTLFALFEQNKIKDNLKLKLEEYKVIYTKLSKKFI